MTLLSEQFLVLASAHFLALLSPGPDFFVLVGNTTTHGVRNGLGVAVGIAGANAGYIAGALAGFSLLTGNVILHTVVRWLGAAFLAWLGWAFIRSARARREWSLAAGAGKRRGFGAGVLTGLLSGGLNPKNGLFYLGLFSLAVGRGTPLGVRVFYGAWMFAVVLAWDALLVLCLRAGAATELLRRYGAKIECFAGACLLGLAVVIAAGVI